MKLYSPESKLCYSLLRWERGEKLSLEEINSLLTDFVSLQGTMSCEDSGIVDLLKVALKDPQITPNEILERFFVTIVKQKYPSWAAHNLLMYLLEIDISEKKKWVTASYTYLISNFETYGRYHPLPETALPYLDDTCGNHLRTSIANYIPYAAAQPTKPYTPKIYSPEEYAEQINIYLQHQNPHGCWVLAHQHGKIEEAIGYLKQGNHYLSLLCYANGGYKDTPVYDYSKYFTKSEVADLYEKGIQYYIQKAESDRVKDGEKYKNCSNYWSDNYIYAACLEEDRGNYLEAAILFEKSKSLTRAANLAIKHDLPVKNHLIEVAVKAHSLELLPFLKDINLQAYSDTVLKLEGELQLQESYKEYEYCEEIANAMGDEVRAGVYKIATKYFNEIHLP